MFTLSIFNLRIYFKNRPYIFILLGLLPNLVKMMDNTSQISSKCDKMLTSFTFQDLILSLCGLCPKSIILIFRNQLFILFSRLFQLLLQMPYIIQKGAHSVLEIHHFWFASL
jgi:hypothetical protein